MTSDQAAPLDRNRLAQALAEADLRVLQMVLVQMTGDLTWLEAPFLPRRDVSLIPEPDAGLSPEAAARMRAAALEILSGPRHPALPDPDPGLLLRMMSVGLGEQVSPEYGPMVREEMGIAPRLPAWRDGKPPARREAFPVLIIGAGICGLALGSALKALDIPFTIVEARDGPGGTWRVNRYPGCGVDTPNHAYSFSFGPRHSWTRYFSRRDEILSYLEGVAEDCDLLPHIRTRTRFVSAHWDASRNLWSCTLDGPHGRETFMAAVLVPAIGQLSEPAIPTLPGQGAFGGSLLHSCDWPEGLRVDGRRVAVIGTGATAMQLVPAIADTVAQLTVYQRTPQWSRPIPGYADRIPDGAAWLLANVPFYEKWFRFNMFWRYGDGLLPFLRRDPDWPHKDRSVNRINDRHRQEMTEFIRTELGDRTDLLPGCVPDYPPYGKRILLDNGWYRTLRKPNVELVTAGIEELTQDGIRTVDGEARAHDLIVLATGFRTTRLAARLDIAGLGGVRLAQAWADDNPTAHLGLCVPGFPNMFTMLGPNSGPAHGGSVIFQAECQTRYIAATLVGMIERDLPAMVVRQAVHDAYVARVDKAHEQLIWTHPGFTTYYRNRHNRVFSVMPWRFVDYWDMTHDPDFEEFEIVVRPEGAGSA